MPLVAPPPDAGWVTPELYREYLDTCRYVTERVAPVARATPVVAAMVFGPECYTLEFDTGVGAGVRVDESGVGGFGGRHDGGGFVEDVGCGRDALGRDGTGVVFDVHSGAASGDARGCELDGGDRGRGGDAVVSDAEVAKGDLGGSGRVPVSGRVGPNGGPSVGRGPNYERNKAARMRKRGRKSLESQENGVPEWRRDARPVVEGDGGVSHRPRGFFSQCAETVREELRNSRAERLVAENRLAAAKANAEVSAMSGVVALVTQLNAVVKTAAQLEKNASDERVKSWARTVVESAISELSEKAPSSVPSLQSVSVSSSASQGKASPATSLSRGEQGVVGDSSVSRAKLSDERLFSQISLGDLDPENPADATEIDRRVYVRQAAERALRQTAHWGRKR